MTINAFIPPYTLIYFDKMGLKQFFRWAWGTDDSPSMEKDRRTKIRRERDAVLLETAQASRALANLYKRILKEHGILQEEGFVELPEMPGADITDIVAGFVKGAKDVPGGPMVKSGIIGYLKKHRLEINEFASKSFSEMKENAEAAKSQRDEQALKRGKIPQ